MEWQESMEEKYDNSEYGWDDEDKMEQLTGPEVRVSRVVHDSVFPFLQYLRLLTPCLCSMILTGPLPGGAGGSEGGGGAEGGGKPAGRGGQGDQEG